MKNRERGIIFVDVDDDKAYKISKEDDSWAIAELTDEEEVVEELTLTVDANIGNADLLGKTAADLQENISISNGKVLGTSKYVEDYTGFSSKVSEQSGNYIALHFASEDGAEIKVNNVKLDADGIFICIINGGNKIRAIATKDDKSAELELSLNELTLEPKPADNEEPAE